MASLALYVSHKSTWILRINIHRDSTLLRGLKFWTLTKN